MPETAKSSAEPWPEPPVMDGEETEGMGIGL